MITGQRTSVGVNGTMLHSDAGRRVEFTRSLTAFTTLPFGCVSVCFFKKNLCNTFNDDDK